MAPNTKTGARCGSRSTSHNPTGSSWLNVVGRFFAEITVKLLRRGVHRSVTALEKDIHSWIEQWNTNPKPYVQ